MSKTIMLTLSVLLATVALGAATTELALDTRTGTRYARAEEPIVFDTAWGENVTRLVLNVDGANALTATTTTNGVYVWRPDFASSRDVTLKLITLRGAVTEALTATFSTATVTAGCAFFFAPSADAAPVSIPYDWFVSVGLAHYGDPASGLAAELAAPYAPGYTGWEAFVAGLTARDQSFRAAVELKDGEVRISWTPNLNTSAVTRIYTVYGRTDLATGDWEPVQPWHRFFKVAVALPTGADGEETAVSGEGFAPRPEPELGGVQLWAGGPFWAECNVGATKPEEYGYYFWWGDTVGYTHDGSRWVAVDGSSRNFLFDNWDNQNPLIATMWKDVDTLKNDGWIDKDGNLAPAHDAATAHLGAPWRMPTEQDLGDLVSNCDWTWTTRNGVSGLLVTGRGGFSSKSIFLPAAGDGCGAYLYDPGSYGDYWSSTPDSIGSNHVWSLDFDSGSFGRYYGTLRCHGFPVRPLRGFAK